MNTTQDIVTINLLKHHCGQKMWCGCRQLLDASDAVQVSNGSTIIVACSACYDKRRCGIRRMARKLESKLEIVDGRSILFDRYGGEPTMTRWDAPVKLVTVGRYVLFNIIANDNTTRPVTGRFLHLTEGDDISAVAARQMWTIHRESARQWAISHHRTGMKLCSSTSIRGAINMAVVKIAGCNPKQMLKSFKQKAIN